MGQTGEKKSTGKRRFRIGAPACLLVILVVALLVASVVMQDNGILQASAAEIESIIKLNVYNGFTEPIETALLNKQTESVGNWAISIVDETLADNGVVLSQIEHSEAKKKIVELVSGTLEAGDIKFDNEGRMTSLSKSYVANAVSGAIAATTDVAGMKVALDANSVSYERIVQVQEALASLEDGNSTIVSSVNAMNAVLRQVDGIDTAILDGAWIDSDSVTNKLSARYTQILAEGVNSIYKLGNGADGDLVSLDYLAGLPSGDTQVTGILAEAINSLYAEQQQILQYLQNSTVDVSAILDQYGSNGSGGSDSNGSNVSIQANGTNGTNGTNGSKGSKGTNGSKGTSGMNGSKGANGTNGSNGTDGMNGSNGTNGASGTNGVNGANAEVDLTEVWASIDALKGSLNDASAVIDTAKSDLDTTIDTTKSELSGTIDATKTELSGTIDSAKNDLSANISKVNSDLESAKSESSKNLESAKSELDKKITDAKSEADKNLESAKSESKSELDKAKTELDKKVTDNKAETDKNLESAKSELDKKITDLKSESKSELDKTKTELDKKITDLKYESKSELNKTKTELDTKITDLKSEADQNLESAKTGLKSEMEKQKADTDQKISDVTDALKEFSDETAANFSKVDESIKKIELSVENLNTTLSTRIDAVETTLTQKLEKMSSDLSSDIADNSAAIRTLQSLTSQYMAGVDGRLKTAVIYNVNIVTANGSLVWKSNGNGESVATIKDTALVGADMAQVNYACQYNIDPVYAIDSENGTLAITISSGCVQNVTIDAIVIYYHSVDSTVDEPAESDPTEPVAETTADELESTSENRTSEDVEPIPSVDKEDA